MGWLGQLRCGIVDVFGRPQPPLSRREPNVLEEHVCAWRFSAPIRDVMPHCSTTLRAWQRLNTCERVQSPHSVATESRTIRPKVRSIIFLYMDGGVSQMDSFDPKPRLDREHGQPFKMKIEATQFNNNGSTLKSPWKFSAIWRKRHSGERFVSARGRMRRRSGRHSLDDLGVFGAQQRQLLLAYRARLAGPAQHGVPGSATAWETTVRTCPTSSCSTAD